MLRKVVGRTTSSSLNQFKVTIPRLSSTIVALRYQSSSTTTTTTTTTTTSSSPTVPATSGKFDLPILKQDQTQEKVKRQPKREYVPLNAKLKDISEQIKTAILANEDLNESYDILEEGISFLRSVQKEEGISDSQIFYKFYPLTIELFTLAQKRELDNKSIVPFKKSLDELLEFFVNNRIATPWHFLQIGVKNLKESSELHTVTEADSYQKFLSLWFKYFEYYKNNEFIFMRKIISIRGKEGEIDYKPYYLNNLAVFAYVQLCCLGEIKYSPVDASKFSTRENYIPLRSNIQSTLSHFGLYNKESFQRFVDFLKLDEKKRFDPNGPKALYKIENSVDKRQLDFVYSEIVGACKEKNIQIDEKIVCALMERYLKFEEYNEVFTLFENIINSGIKPSINAWNIAIRAMTNPTRIRSEIKYSKKLLVENFERTIKTILASGLSFNGETIGAIVSGYANLGDFVKANEYMTQYASIPGATNLANDGLLRGLISNNQVDQAEQKLHEFMSKNKKKKNQNEFYKPSTNVMNDFLNYHIKKKNYSAVNGLTQFMRQHEIEENVATRTILINAYFDSLHAIGKTPDLSTYLAQMEESSKANKKGFNEQMHSTLLKGLIQGGNIEAARQLFVILKKRYPRSAWLNTQIIVAEVTLGDVKLGEDLFNRYIKEIKNDVIIWNTFIHNLLQKDERLAYVYFNKMKQNGSNGPNFYTYYFMLQHYRRKGNKDKVQQLVNELNSNKLDDYGNVLPKFVASLSGYVDVPVSLLERIQS